MKIKTTSSFYVVGIGVFDARKVIDIDDEIAKKLIDEGFAVLDDDKEVKEQEPTKKEEIKDNIEETPKEIVEEVEEVIKEVEEEVEIVVDEDTVNDENIDEETEKQREKTPRYYAMRVAELRAILEEKGIEIPEGARKKDLLALLDYVK